MEMIIGLGASPWPNFKRYRMERPTAGITPATVIPGIEFVPFRPEILAEHAEALAQSFAESDDRMIFRYFQALLVALNYFGKLREGGILFMRPPGWPDLLQALWAQFKVCGTAVQGLFKMWASCLICGDVALAAPY